MEVSEDWIEIAKILAPILGLLLICLFQAHCINSSICGFLDKISVKVEEKMKRDMRWFIFQTLFGLVIFAKLAYLIYLR